jgi:hypothetical protein
MTLDGVAGEQPVMLSVSGFKNSDVDAVSLKRRRRRIATSEGCRQRAVTGCHSSTLTDTVSSS